MQLRCHHREEQVWPAKTRLTRFFLVYGIVRLDVSYDRRESTRCKKKRWYIILIDKTSERWGSHLFQAGRMVQVQLWGLTCLRPAMNGAGDGESKGMEVPVDPPPGENTRPVCWGSRPLLEVTLFLE